MRPSAILVFLLSFLPLEGLCCNVHVRSKNRAKIVEDYVLSANFNERRDVPQLGELPDSPEAKDVSQMLPPYKSHAGVIGDFEDRNPLEERDLLVHHHHVPPPHPPPPPPPPVGLALGPSMFAMGLMAFLILLNGLSSQLLMIMKTKTGLLGTGSNVLGRKRRKRRSTSGWDVIKNSDHRLTLSETLSRPRERKYT